MVISVIIATKNAVHYLPETIASLRLQEDADFQCIIIDGGSIDGTIDIIRSNGDIVDTWISEKDNGIAEAFNKGIQLANGDLIYFLGSDDVLHDDRVFADILAMLPTMPRPYFFYGDLYYVYTGGKKKLVACNYSKKRFSRYNCIPHQAMFLDQIFFKRYGLFETSYKYAMDYEHISRFIDDYQPRHINRVITEMRRYGKSSDVLATHKEMDTIRLNKGYAGRSRIVADHLWLRIKMTIALAMRLNW